MFSRSPYHCWYPTTFAGVFALAMNHDDEVLDAIDPCGGSSSEKDEVVYIDDDTEEMAQEVQVVGRP